MRPSEFARARRPISNAADTGPRAKADVASGHPLLGLQRLVGNQAINRLLAGSTASDELDMPEVGKDGGEVSDALGARIEHHRGGGMPLDDRTRAAMESVFDTDFSDVRLHTGEEASNLSLRVGARAFTTGSDIFLGSGTGPHDQRTLAHELIHVMQQRTIHVHGPLTVSAAEDSHEREAESVAASISASAADAPG